MKTIMEKAGYLFLTLVLAGLVAAAPSFAGMGAGSGGSDRGSGSKNDSESGMSSSMGSKENRKDMGNKSGQTNMDFGFMSEISTGGLGSGDMTMDVKPVKYKNGRLEVEYYANTHSVSLGKYDLMELCTLEVDGKVYKPVTVDQMNGHHAGGRIIFEVPERPEQFRLVIRGIPQVKERSFDWN